MDFKLANKLRVVNAILGIFCAVTIFCAANILSEKFYVKKSIFGRDDALLSDTTKDFLHKNEKLIDIFVLIDSSMQCDDICAMVRRDISNLLKKYSALDVNSNLHIEFVDPVADKNKYNSLVERFGRLPENVVVLSCDGSNKVIPITDLYNIVNAELVSFRGEMVLTYSFIRISGSEKFVIYILSGHGEYAASDMSARFGLSSAINFLRNKNYVVKALDLVTEKVIPSDADLLLIVGAQHNLLDFEVEEIRRFLDVSGGCVFVAVNPYNTAGLVELFADWGISIDGKVLSNGNSGNLNLDQDLVIKMFAPHEITENLVNFHLPIVLGKTCAVDVIEKFEFDERFVVTALAQSDKSATAVCAQLVADKEIEGPFNVAVLSDKTMASANGINIKNGKLFVVGNDTWLTNSKFNLLGNRIFFSNVISFMINDEYNLDIASTQIKQYKLTMRKHEFAALVAKLSIVPLVFLLLGIAVVRINRR